MVFILKCLRGKINLTFKPPHGLWPSYTPGNALCETLSTRFFAHILPLGGPSAFLPGGLYPPFKSQFGRPFSLPTELGSNYFLTFLYILQPKHFCYSLPVLFLSVYQDLQQGTAVQKKKKKPLLWLPKALLSHLLQMTCGNYICSIYFGTWFWIVLFIFCLLFLSLKLF